ncbi:MAG TPA: hypothetical protein PLS84_11700 [Salinivirgaceae bacterium]|nr:hypothetical protein [Salinivirgaceae bacterium]
MDYLEIILQGYFNENNREFLEGYFFREFKKAEKEQFFEAVEFFNGCLKVIEGWEKHLQDKVFERKRELYLMLNEAKNGTLSYAELEGKTIEEKWRETIQYCEQELKDVRPDGIGSLSFTVHLHSLTNGRIAYNMAYSEVLQIKLSILKAFKKTQPNIEPLPPQPIVEGYFSVLEWATIFYYADETKLLTESRLIKTRLEQFMSKHQINTTFDNFKTKYYEAKKRINEKNDYPINKLELIIPFLEENYKQTVTKVYNDITFLKENKPEY